MSRSRAHPTRAGATSPQAAKGPSPRSAFDDPSPIGVAAPATSTAAARPSHAEVLRQAVAQWSLRLPEPAIEQLLAYLDLLQRWNRVYNLSAIRDPEQMVVQHVLDCLAVVPAIDRWLTTETQAADRTPEEGAAGRSGARLQVLDVGSGGGLPGVVLAIARPEWAVDCVDTVGKKASFIGQVAAELRLPTLRGLHSRVEQLPVPPRLQPGVAPGYGLVTSRAFASLVDFTALTHQLLAPAGVWLAMKGRAPTDEQLALPKTVSVFHVEPLAVPGLDAERCLVWMRSTAERRAQSDNP